MTIEQVRDEIAGLLGWSHVWETDSITRYGVWKHKDGEYLEHGQHPCPSTLDGIAAIWPNGWTWNRGYEGDTLWWDAMPVRRDVGPYPCIRDTGNELEARTRLLLEVLRAERNRA